MCAETNRGPPRLNLGLTRGPSELENSPALDTPCRIELTQRARYREEKVSARKLYARPASSTALRRGRPTSRTDARCRTLTVIAATATIFSAPKRGPPFPWASGEMGRFSIAFSFAVVAAREGPRPVLPDSGSNGSAGWQRRDGVWVDVGAGTTLWRKRHYACCRLDRIAARRNDGSRS